MPRPSASLPPQAGAGSEPGRPALGPGAAPTARQDLAWAGGLALAGLVLMYGPLFWQLAGGLWRSDEQGHGPIILVLVGWLFYRRRELLAAAFAPDAGRYVGWLLLGLGCLLYVAGRSQSITIFAVGSLMPVLAALLLLLTGRAGLKACWFPILFVFFLVPLPGAVVDALTQPMKMAVSAVVEALLHALGYPIARVGVILHVGRYQLLVADACAGLHTLFTVEALGLLYLNVMGHTERLRNALMALLIVPISFLSNVVRVVILVLVTYHLGDAAGQGFVHDFAGLVLFMVALALTILVDGLLGRTLFRRRGAEAGA